MSLTATSSKGDMISGLVFIHEKTNTVVVFSIRFAESFPI